MGDFGTCVLPSFDDVTYYSNVITQKCVILHRDKNDDNLNQIGVSTQVSKAHYMQVWKVTININSRK
jgi:hypothetical protein